MKITREEREGMTKDEMLRSLWVLDEYVDNFGWHIISIDGFPEQNKQGFWCKKDDGKYERLWYDDGFFTYYSMHTKIYVKENTVIAWQRLTELG